MNRTVAMNTTRLETVTALRREGFFSVADWVANSYHPGKTVAAVYEIREYCEDRGLKRAASIIALYLG